LYSVTPGEIQAASEAIYITSYAASLMSGGVTVVTRDFGAFVNSFSSFMFMGSAAAFSCALTNEPGERLPTTLMGIGNGLIGASLQITPASAKKLFLLGGCLINIIGGMLSCVPEVSSNIENGICRLAYKAKKPLNLVRAAFTPKTIGG